MAYRITFYCTTGGIAATQAVDEIVSRSADLGTALTVSSLNSGPDWTSGDVDFAANSPGSSGCHLELRTASELTAAMIAQVADEENSVRSADSVATLTLVGNDINWAVVKAIWTVVRDLWPTIPYDEGSGFDVDLTAL